MILRVLDLIEKTTGKRPKGWLSSSLRCTVNTSDICKELGLTYHCDYMNDEQPYLIKTAHGPLVSTPYTQEANDIGMFLRRNLTADEAFGLWKDEFDELYRAGEKSGRMMSIGLHPHIIGRAFRVRAHPRIPRLREDVRRRVVDDPRGDRGLVSEEPRQSYRVAPSVIPDFLELAAHHQDRGAVAVIGAARPVLEGGPAELGDCDDERILPDVIWGGSSERRDGIVDLGEALRELSETSSPVGVETDMLEHSHPPARRVC